MLFTNPCENTAALDIFYNNGVIRAGSDWSIMPTDWLVKRISLTVLF